MKPVASKPLGCILLVAMLHFGWVVFVVRLKAIYVSGTIFRVTVVLRAGCVLSPTFYAAQPPEVLYHHSSLLSTLTQICIIHSHVSF